MIEPATTIAKPARPLLRTLEGVVASDKGNKTIKVVVNYQTRHPKYGKFMRRKTVCYVHDESNSSKLGDEVEIMESRPLSKLKRWRLVRVVTSSGEDAPASEGAAPAAGSDAASAKGESAGKVDTKPAPDAKAPSDAKAPGPSKSASKNASSGRPKKSE